MDSDAVSWLPPSHPRAVITQPAAMDRRQRYKLQTNKENTKSEADDYNKTDSEEVCNVLKHVFIFLELTHEPCLINMENILGPYFGFKICVHRFFFGGRTGSNSLHSKGHY